MRWAEPSERNWEIFCEVQWAGQSLGLVAADRGMTVEKVAEVVRGVKAWYVASTPDWVDEVPAGLQPYVACRMHEGRLDYLYGEAMRAYRASKDSLAQNRFLHQAMRISEGTVRASVRLEEIKKRFPLHGSAATHPSEEETPNPSAEDVANPSEEDYAREREIESDENGEEPDVVSISNVIVETCGDRWEAGPSLGAVTPPIPDPKRAGPGLSRRERRKLARRLRRAK